MRGYPSQESQEDTTRRIETQIRHGGFTRTTRRVLTAIERIGPECALHQIMREAKSKKQATINAIRYTEYVGFLIVERRQDHPLGNLPNRYTFAPTWTREGGPLVAAPVSTVECRCGRSLAPQLMCPACGAGHPEAKYAWPSFTEFTDRPRARAALGTTPAAVASRVAFRGESRKVDKGLV